MARVTGEGERLREALGYGSEYSDICSLLARARAEYRRVGEATDGRPEGDYARWHRRMLRIEKRLQWLSSQLPGSSVMFCQDASGDWFAFVGRTYKN